MFGCEYAFDRSAVAIDATRLHDAVIGASSNIFGLTWRYAHSSHLDWSITGGAIDSSIVDDVAFVSVALGLRN